MRTTIDINDALLAAAKSHAARNQKTLKALLEQALREFLSGRRDQSLTFRRFQPCEVWVCSLEWT